MSDVQLEQPKGNGAQPALASSKQLAMTRRSPSARHLQQEVELNEVLLDARSNEALEQAEEQQPKHNYNALVHSSVKDSMTKRDRTHADVKAYNGKLNRMQFVQRLVLENNMLRTILAVLLYIPMVAFYISALLTYDPFEYVTVCTVLSDYDTFSGCRLITGMHKTVMTGFDLASLTDNPVNNREDLYLFMGLHMD